MELLASFASQGARYELGRRVRDLTSENSTCKTSLLNCQGGQLTLQASVADYQRLVAAIESIYPAPIADLSPEQIVVNLAKERKQLVDAVIDLNRTSGGAAGRTPVEMVGDVKGRLRTAQEALRAKELQTKALSDQLSQTNGANMRLKEEVEDCRSAFNKKDDALATCDTETQRLKDEHRDAVDALRELSDAISTLYESQKGPPSGRSPLQMVNGIKEDIFFLQDELLTDQKRGNEVKNALERFAQFLKYGRLRKGMGIVDDDLDASVEFQTSIVEEAKGYIIQLEETLKCFLRLCEDNLGDVDFISAIAKDDQGRNLAVILCSDLAQGIDTLKQRLAIYENDDDAFQDTTVSGSYYFSGLSDLRSLGDIVNGRLHRLEDRVRELQDLLSACAKEKLEREGLVEDLLSACAKEKLETEGQVRHLQEKLKIRDDRHKAIDDVIIALADIAQGSGNVSEPDRSRLKGLIARAREIPAVRELLKYTR